MSSDERFPYSRRAIVGVGGMGLVAAAAPAFAQSSKEQPLSKPSETPAPEALQDPAHQISQTAVSPTGAALAGTRKPNGSASGSRRDVLSRARAGSPAARLW